MKIKKLVVLLLLAILVTSVFGFGSIANAEEAGARSTSTERVASFSIYESYPTTSYPKNTPIALKDGTTEAGTMSFNINLYHDSGTNPLSATYQALKVTKDTVFTLIPNSSCTIKKVIMSVYQGQGTPGLAVKDSYYQTLFTPTSADRAQIGAESDITLLGMQFGDSFEATEETPYQFGVGNYASMYIKRVYVIYEAPEKVSYTETVSTNRNTYSDVQTGGAKLNIGSTGYRDGSSVVINSRDKIDVIPKPGFVILSITFDANKQGLSFTSTPDDNLTLTYKGTNAKSRHDFELIGFQPGQTYVLESSYYTYYQLYNVTVTYIEHEHAQGDLVLEHDETNHWYKCTVCNGTNINPQPHTLVDGEVIKQPGNGLPGEQLQTCLDCLNTITKYLPCPITDPALTVELANQLTYNGSEQAQKVTIKVGDVVLEEDVDYTLSNNIQTNAGNYTLTIAGIGKYNGERTLDFTIEKCVLKRPSGDSDTFYYNGSQQTYLVTPKPSIYTISGNKQTEVGTHIVEVTLKDEVLANYRWEETDEPTITYEFVINKGRVTVPTEDSTIFTYNGQPQTYKLATNSKYTIGGKSLTQTSAGTYIITVSLNDPEHYQWRDGPEGDLTFEFVIHKAVVAKPAADPTVFYYTGNQQTYYIESNSMYNIGNNKKTNAGTYTVSVTLKPAIAMNYQWEGEDPNDSIIGYEFVINRAIVQRPAVDPTVYTFTGNSYKYQIETNEHYSITYTNGRAAQMYPGSYPITVKLNDNRNYVWDDGTSDKLTYDFTIHKGKLDVESLVFADKEVVFDGTAHSIEIENLPSEFKVTYEGNGQVNLGTYTITAHISLVNAFYESYYEELPTLTATLSITKAKVAKPTADETKFVYNGLAQTYTLASNDLFYTISGDSLTQTNAGTYTITASLINPDYCQWDDGSEGDLTYTFVISKATYDMSGVVFTGKTVTYNGQVHALEATNLPAGVTVSYENNNQTNAGDYTVTANFVGNANYNDIASQTAQLVIEKATYDMSGVAFVDQTVTYTGSKFYLDVTGVPTGVEVTYENNGHSDVGEYTVIAKFAVDANHNAISNLTATLTINKAQVAKPANDTTNFVYTGSALTYAVEASDLYTVSGNVQTNAGSYTVEIALKDKANYEWTDGTIDSFTYSFVIAKATYDMSGVVFGNETVTFDGSAQSILATNLPAGVTVTYENNEQTVVGTYTITANFAGDKDNYNAIPSQTATLTIAKAILAKPAQDTTNFVYTGSALTYTVATNNFYTVSGNVQTNAGSYTVKIALKDKANCEWADGTTDDLAYNFAIAKATHDMSGVVFADTTVTYDGESHSILATNLPNGVTVTYENNGKTVVGNYTITATFTVDENNYNTIENKTAQLVIEKAQVAKPATDETSFVYTGSALTYAVATSDLYTVSGNVETNAGSYTVEITLKDKANYEWTDETVTDLTFNFVIEKAQVTKPVADTTVFVYNSQAQTYTIAASDLYTVAGNVETLAGNYTVTVTLKDKANYEWTDETVTDLTFDFVIEKATYDMGGVVFADKTVVYTGSAFSIEATNLPAGVTVSYENNDKTNVGDYTVTANFAGNANYNAIPSKTAQLVIKKAQVAKPVADTTVFVYNSQAQTYTIVASDLYTVAGNVETLAGNYTVTVTLKDKANYEWTDETVTDLTFDFVIAKATYDMSGVTFVSKTVTYDGESRSILATNLPAGVTVTYENNDKTNVGDYTVTANFAGDANNYNAIERKTAQLVIEKAQVAKPATDTTSFVYTGSALTYAVATSDLYTVSGNVQTNAGSYTVEIALKDKANYEWTDGTIEDLAYNFAIAKATYDMSGVVFADKTVVYTGSAFSIEATNLPAGVTVTYENNDKVDANQYTVTANFAGDANNYNAIPSKTATLTIKHASLPFNTDDNNDIANDIIISCEQGIHPSAQLTVKQLDVEQSAEDFEQYLDKNQQIGVIYDVKLIQGGQSVQPDGTLIFKILIPQELRNREFGILHIHGNQKNEVEFDVQGDYVVFTTDNLSEFVFIYDTGSLLWIVILLAVVALLEVALLAYLAKKTKQSKNVKVSAIYPPFVFGMFVPEWHIALIVALSLIVVALAVVCILMTIKVFFKGEQTTAVANSAPAKTAPKQPITDGDKGNTQQSKR